MPTPTLDIALIREQFPVLEEVIRGRPLAYLDNAATTQKPWAVLRAMQMYYQHDNANVHRGVHTLSARATEAYERARRLVQEFVGAEHSDEIIFTKGCTEAINLVASSWGRANLNAGDRILISHMEHHANIVPWQAIAAERGASIHPIPITDEGCIDLDAYGALLAEGAKVVAVNHVSNVLGTRNPVEKMIEMAHAVGAIVLVDGAQAGAHERPNVRAMGADFYALTAHKMYGPTGIGAIYGRKELLDAMPPYQFGGDMIRTVSFEGSTFAALPNKFEAGTPNIAGAIGWGAAIEWLTALSPEAIEAHEHALYEQAVQGLAEFPEVRLIGTAPGKKAVVNFVMSCAHPHDIGTILDQSGVAVRTGHHCCMPLMRRFGVPATARASIAIYNSAEDITAFHQGLRRVVEMFG